MEETIYKVRNFASALPPIPLCTLLNNKIASIKSCVRAVLT